jgi:carbonic anhydrase/acetyltransferase-like protein (isoleucine patch superfamily)
MGSILLDNVELGDWCFVAAGTLLTPGKKFPTKSFILGSPGRRIREVSAQEMDWVVHSWKSYQDLTERYLRQRKAQ